MWEVETTDAFDEWWHTLTEQEQDDVTAVVELLEERGAHLPYPCSSSIEVLPHAGTTHPVTWQSQKGVLCVLILGVLLSCSSVESRPRRRSGFTTDVPH
jgi:hypothetical protein